MLIILIVMALVAVVASQGAPGAVLVVAAGTPREQRPLLIRFIDRSRRFRRAGAIAGVVLTTAALVVLDAENDGGGSPAQVDLLVLASVGLGGSILGSVAAEAFRLRRPRGPRIASLTVRESDAYADPVAERRARFLLPLAVVGAAASFVVEPARERSLVVLGLTLVLLLLRRWVVARVALRARPVLPPHLEAADDRVRSLASSAGLSRPIVTLVAMLGSIQWAALAATPSGDPTTPAEVVNGVAVVVSLALFCVATAWWWQNRSFGLRAVGPGRQTIRHRTWVRAAAAIGAVGLLGAVVATLRNG